MVRRKLKCGGTTGRQKAWIGALISAGAGLASSLLNKNAQKKAERIQKIQAENTAKIQQGQQLASALANYQNVNDAYNERLRMDYANGGKVRPKAGLGWLASALPYAGQAIGTMADAFAGGLGSGYNNNSEYTAEELNSAEQDAINNRDMQLFKHGGKVKLDIKNGRKLSLGGNRFLLQGNTHERGGIDIDKGKVKVEAEGGEGVKDFPTETRIYSNRLIVPDGTNRTFAKAFADGDYNDEYLFAMQQNRNGDNQSSPVKRKAALGMTLGLADYLGAGIGVLGSVLANTTYRKSLSDLGKYAPAAPSPYVIGKLRTDYNINPQLSVINNNLETALDEVDRNSISSAGGINRANKLRLAAAIQKNALYAEKNNKEAEYVNADIQNTQNTINSYIDQLNTWRNAKNAYKANLAQLKADSNVAMIQGIGDSLTDMLQSGIDRYQNNQAMLAYLAASPYGTAEKLHSFGYRFDKPIMRSLRNFADSRLTTIPDDNDKNNIKAYNDAVDSYNYWNTVLKGKGSNKTHRKLRNAGVTNYPSILNWDWYTGTPK